MPSQTPLKTRSQNFENAGFPRRARGRTVFAKTMFRPFKISMVYILVFLCINSLFLLHLSDAKGVNGVCSKESVSTFETGNGYSLSGKRHIIHLATPESNFHSHSWWHMTEHYVSRRHLKLGMDIPDDGILTVIAFSQEFVDLVNPMAIFLLMASFSTGGVGRVELYAPPDKLHTTAAGIAYFSPVGPRRYVYDKRHHEDAQFFYEDVSAASGCIMGKYMGSVGEVAIERGHFFPDGPELLRATTARICENYEGKNAFNNHNFQHREERKPQLKERQLLVFQRDQDRKMVPIESVQMKLEQALGWNVATFEHDEFIHPCSVYSNFHNADVVLTVHGYQGVGILFMQEHSLFLEIFPYKYFKTTYILLAAEMRVDHDWFQDEFFVSISRFILAFVSQDTCMNSGWCRDFARKDDVTVNKDILERIITIIRRWLNSLK